MKNPLLLLCRLLTLRRHRSPVPTGLLTLTAVHSAVVFVDPAQADAEAVCGEVRRFFDDNGIMVRVLCPRRQDLNWMGCRKSRLRTEDGPWEVDLFISLAGSPEDFAAEFEARCCPARFKVGRFQLSGDVFDLVVGQPEDAPAGQAAVFAAMKDYLQKIR